MKVPPRVAAVAFDYKKKVFSHYGQQFSRNPKNGFECLKLI
jgi:hypothetical protein